MGRQIQTGRPLVSPASRGKLRRMAVAAMAALWLLLTSLLPAAEGPWYKGPRYARATPVQVAKIRHFALIGGVDLPCMLRQYGTADPHELSIAQAAHLINALARRSEDTFTAPINVNDRISAASDNLSMRALWPWVWIFKL